MTTDRDQRNLRFLLARERYRNPARYLDSYIYASNHAPGNETLGEEWSRATAVLPFVPGDHHLEMFRRMRSAR